MRRLLKALLPDRPVPLVVLRGPFRGARMPLNPRASLRKVLGLYEHENNAWLARALRGARRVIDVGAGDGYFTFGSAAVLARAGGAGEVHAFESDPRLARGLAEAAAASPERGRIHVVNAAVGRVTAPGAACLDDLDVTDRADTLVKIDVEGAEIDVVDGAASWLVPSNRFLIEVHQAEYLVALQETFAARGLGLRRVDQRPLPIVGAERRDAANWWLVSEPR